MARIYTEHAAWGNNNGLSGLICVLENENRWDILQQQTPFNPLNRLLKYTPTDGADLHRTRSLGK